MVLNESTYPSDLTFCFTFRSFQIVAEQLRFKARSDTGATDYFMLGVDADATATLQANVPEYETNSYINQVAQTWSATTRDEHYDDFMDNVSRLYTGRNLDISAWAEYCVGDSDVSFESLTYDFEEVILTSNVGLTTVESGLMDYIGIS